MSPSSIGRRRVMSEGKPGNVGDMPWNLEEAEIVLIQRALKETEGNVTRAAELLGVNRMRLYRAMARKARGVAGQN